jgi:hypothetical protein
MEYRGYTLEVDLVYTEFGQSICWIKQSGLTAHKVTGWTADEAIAAGKRWIDFNLDKGA